MDPLKEEHLFHNRLCLFEGPWQKHLPCTFLTDTDVTDVGDLVVPVDWGGVVLYDYIVGRFAADTN